VQRAGKEKECALGKGKERGGNLPFGEKKKTVATEPQKGSKRHRTCVSSPRNRKKKKEFFGNLIW